jgi:hypothetical protein
MNYHNIERSGFRHGEYVAWDKNGNRYRVRKDGPRRDKGSWWVYPQDKTGLPCFYAGTLALVSLRLERMSAICAMPRLSHE